jgi:hypothetical protein
MEACAVPRNKIKRRHRDRVIPQGRLLSGAITRAYGEKGRATGRGTKETNRDKERPDTPKEDGKEIVSRGG